MSYRHVRNALAVASVTLGLASIASAQIRINEIFINPAGTDNGTEFIELLSDTGGFSMSGLTLLIVEGDGSSAGVIDQALSLSAFSTGTNGLFLWRDSATVLSPAPDAATTLNVADFNPDIENGSNTFFLVSGFTGAVGDDLDTNDDGTLDVTPWGGVVDSIALQENDGTANLVYSTNFITNTGFNADALARANNFGDTLVGADFLGSSSGPFSEDLDRTSRTFGDLATAYNLTPGSLNIFPTTAAPEPGSLALLGLLGLPAIGLLRRRK
jgi:hypothetical protein